jgi:hypothetical protein
MAQGLAQKVWHMTSPLWDRSGFADPDEVAVELGIGTGEVTELVRQYQGYFEWNSIPIGKLKLRS